MSQDLLGEELKLEKKEKKEGRKKEREGGGGKEEGRKRERKRRWNERKDIKKWGKTNILNPITLMLQLLLGKLSIR